MHASKEYTFLHTCVSKVENLSIRSTHIFCCFVALLVSACSPFPFYPNTHVYCTTRFGVKVIN